jgi:hypothetical protein
MAELTERQWDVYSGIRDRKTPAQIAADMGVTVSYVTQLRGELRDMGVIRRRGELPAHGRYEEVYPWELVSDQPPAYKPALPPKAKLRLEYPKDVARDVTVATIRHVWWPWPEPRWSVQGLPTSRPDGRPPHEVLADQRVVLMTFLPHGELAQWSFPASTKLPWRESNTQKLVLVTGEDYRAMTLLIAAAIGVDAVMDLTGKEPHQ